MNKIITVQGIQVYYEESQEETLKIISANIESVLKMLSDSWGIKPISDCRIYVMDDLDKFLLKSSPLYLKPLVLLNLLLAKKRLNYLWQQAGGWGKRYGDRYVIGIKDKRLLEASKSDIGDKIFIKEANINEKLIHILCHEMAHACTSSYQMPSWLHEGLAMVAVDKLLSKQTVKPETVERLKLIESFDKPKSMEDIYISGYWIAKHLDDHKPEILQRILKNRNCFEDSFIKEVMGNSSSLSHMILREI